MPIKYKYYIIHTSMANTLIGWSSSDVGLRKIESELIERDSMLFFFFSPSYPYRAQETHENGTLVFGFLNRAYVMSYL